MTTCKACGSSWFEERRIMQLPHDQPFEQPFPPRAAANMYRLYCADCHAPIRDEASNDVVDELDTLLKPQRRKPTAATKS